jgi:LAO/AO transport system kinase
MEERKKISSAISVERGIDQPPSVNPKAFHSREEKRRRKYSAEEYVNGILAGNITLLSRAITIIESSLDEHSEIAEAIIEASLPYSGKSVRIGITGVPGVGKSSFIEEFGLFIAEQGRKLAVLAVDPSSRNSGGSILGDKTRMEKLSNHSQAFIRPSPSAGTLGGVARKTRETIILCEAAGFNTILVETVGVGQSETAVHSMVDFFLLLMLAGAGDELQGIKRGIMEMADAIAITKADGHNITSAETARLLYQNALRLFPPSSSGWNPVAITCSAKEKRGMDKIWETILEYEILTRSNEYFEKNRNDQNILTMDDAVMEYLMSSFRNNERVKALRPRLERLMREGRITSYKAALGLLENYLKE